MRYDAALCDIMRYYVILCVSHDLNPPLGVSNCAMILLRRERGAPVRNQGMHRPATPPSSRVFLDVPREPCVKGMPRTDGTGNANDEFEPKARAWGQHGPRLPFKLWGGVEIRSMQTRVGGGCWGCWKAAHSE